MTMPRLPISILLFAAMVGGALVSSTSGHAQGATSGAFRLDVSGTRAAGALSDTASSSSVMLHIESKTGFRTGNAYFDYVLKFVGLYDGHSQWVRAHSLSRVRTEDCSLLFCRPATEGLVPASHSVPWRLTATDADRSGSAKLEVAPSVEGAAYDAVVFLAGVVIDHFLGISGCINGFSASDVASLAFEVGRMLVWEAEPLGRAMFEGDTFAFTTQLFAMIGRVLDSLAVAAPELALNSLGECVKTVLKSLARKAAVVLEIALPIIRGINLVVVYADTVVSGDASTEMRVAYIPVRGSPPVQCVGSPPTCAPRCDASPFLCVTPDRCAQSPSLCVSVPPSVCERSPSICRTPPTDPCVASPRLCVTPPPDPCRQSPLLCYTPPPPPPCGPSPSACTTPPADPCKQSPALCLTPTPADPCRQSPTICFTPTRVNPCIQSPPLCATRPSSP